MDLTRDSCLDGFLVKTGKHQIGDPSVPTMLGNDNPWLLSSEPLIASSRSERFNH
jgi:hypothetical protein